MIEEIRVLTVRCDDCRTWLHDDDYNVYFPDEQAIDDAIPDQEWTADKGTHLCPTCACARKGHRMEAFKEQGYRSCDCGAKYDRAIVIRDVLERV